MAKGESMGHVGEGTMPATALCGPADTKFCIAFVVPEIGGQESDGDRLARMLAGAGHDVIVLCSALRTGTPPDAVERRRAAFAADGIRFDTLDQADRGMVPERYYPGNADLASAVGVHRWLKTVVPDIVILADWRGHGYFAQVAKRGGFHHTRTAFLVLARGPTLWRASERRLPLDEPETMLTLFLERQSVSFADGLLSYDHDILDWMRRHGFTLPREIRVLPKPLFPAVKGRDAAVHSMSCPVREVVFLGRLEHGDGLVRFCDAVERVSAWGGRLPAVTFLGSCGFVDGEHALAYLARRTAAWPCPVRFRMRMTREEAIRYLKEGNGLAVIASLGDLASEAVSDCLIRQVPFLARSGGGIPDLIDPRDHRSCLFGDHPVSLAERLAAAAEGGQPPARPAVDFRSVMPLWLSALQDLHVRMKPLPRPPAMRSPVTVCLVHHQRPQLLLHAIRSLDAQTHRNFDVVLVDDGSTDLPSRQLLDSLESVFAERGWAILRQDNHYLGRARNAAARLARGEYLLFMDDDNVAHPDELELLVRAAEVSGADVVTCFANVFEGADYPDPDARPVEHYLPVGDALGYALAGNPFGDANALVRRDLFERLGGFTEDYGVGNEDLEFFIRAALANARFAVVPEPLLWYRRQPGSMLSTTGMAANRFRTLRPWMNALPAPIADIVVFAHGILTRRAIDASRTSADMADGAGDPDDPSVLAAACGRLVAAGRAEAAIEILDEIGMAHERSPAVLEVAVRCSAASGDGEETLTRFDALAARISAGRASAIACELAESLAGHARGLQSAVALFGRAIELEPDSIDARLKAALFVAGHGHEQSALPLLETATAIAERIYLERRPDVARAIERGEFPSAIFHFQKHGRFEGAPWPSGTMFGAVVAALPHVPVPIGRVPDAMRERLLAVFAAFPATDGRS